MVTVLVVNGTDGTYGDQITLQAAADLYNIEVLVVSTLGHNATTLISPSASIPYARVQLGHYAEQHGEHYICVEGGTLYGESLDDIGRAYFVELVQERQCFSVNRVTGEGQHIPEWV